MSSPRVILSGTQPSGAIHVGNYFGAMRQYLQLVEQGHRCFFFIANYHSLTSIRDRTTLLDLTRDVAVAYLAAGLDPSTATLYRQSDLPEVTELSWILSTLTPMGLLERCHAAAGAGAVDAALLALDSQVTDCNAALFDVANDFAGCIAGCHEVLRRQGLLEGTWCLDPQETLSPGQATLIDRVQHDYPWLVDDAFVRSNLERWLAP